MKLWWHDGGKGPPEELGKELISTYNKVPGNGVLFAGSKGILCSDCWGVGGVVKLKGEAKCRGVQDHAACKPVPVTLPRVARQFRRWRVAKRLQGRPRDVPGLRDRRDDCRDHHGGDARLAFQPGVETFSTIEWDSDSLQVKTPRPTPSCICPCGRSGCKMGIRGEVQFMAERKSRLDFSDYHSDKSNAGFVVLASVACWRH